MPIAAPGSGASARLVAVFLCAMAVAACAPPSGAGDLQRAPTLAVALATEGAREGAPSLERELVVTEQVVGRRATPGNRVRLLIDGPATHEAMFAAMREARHSIELESYIIEDDQAGQELAQLLLAQRARGVSVSVIYDSVGSIGTPRSYFDRLRDAGIPVCEFNPVSPTRARLGWNLNKRDHRKILVVDGAVGFTGGINISSVYSTGSGGSSAHPPDEKHGWRDTHIEVRGPAVREMQRLYDDTWTGQRCAERARAHAPPVRAFPDGKPALVMGGEPDEQPSTVYLAFLAAIANAQRSVHITQAYFVPDPRTLDALMQAARRGIDVTLVLPSLSDSWAPLAAGRSHYDELLAAGVRIVERQEALLHAKTAVIDGVWSTVGSSNLDWRSFVHNQEANVIVFDDGFGREMERMFERDVARSKPISASQWSRRGPLERMREWTARWFAYLL